MQKLTHLYPETEINSFFYLLLEKLYGKRQIDLSLHPELRNKDWPDEAFRNALKELEQEKPIQYILGEAEFAGLTFMVNEHVLIPRPETEELALWILESLDENAPVGILDLGTGSGCIPITLAKRLTMAEVHGLDVSERALEIARGNAETLGVQVHFFNFDVLTTDSLEETYDVMVSNPPYVRWSEKEQMRGNVLKHEPELALFVDDADPLVFYRKIGRLGLSALRPNGMLFFEINENLAEQVSETLDRMSYQSISVRKDIYGKDRMIRAYKK